MQNIIFLQAVYQLAFLEIITFHNLGSQQFLNLILVAVEIPIQVRSQFSFQRVENGRIIIHVTFKLSHFFQVLQQLFTLPVIGEVLFFSILLESLKIFIRHLEVFGRSDFLMFLGPFGDKVRQEKVCHQIEHHSRCFRFFYFKVRGNTASIPNGTSFGSIEYRRQAIWNSPDATICFPVRIVHLLDTTAARDIIFAHRHFHTSIIRKFTGRLHKSLSERTLSNQHSTVHIL